MTDLISRQAAIQHLKKRLYETALNNITEHPYYEEMADNRVDVWLNEIPSAERHGRWVDIPFTARWICSNCDYISEFASFKYCPDCGTKMDEEEETFNTTPYTECVVNLYTETKLRFVLDEYIEDEELIEKILKALDDEK